jgi:hypothetical protein
LLRRSISSSVGLAAAAIIVLVSSAAAQEPPPRIGPVVIDLQGTVPLFPRDEALAASRAVQVQELPHRGLGVHGGVHVYPLRWKAVTFGVGVDATAARARATDPPLTPTIAGRTTTETFRHIAPEISFNFGTGNGWSYLSGGIGPGIWSVQAEGGPAIDANSERLKTINYGGGARWFMKHHLAFSFDVRLYAINPSTPAQGLPPGPRTTLLFVGAGVSLK